MARRKISLDIVICLGKSPNEDGSLDPVLEERVKLAYKIAKEQKAILVLSGGTSHKTIKKRKFSEAKAMQNYILDKFGTKGLKIILEERGQSTIQQLCIIKNELLLPNNWESIGIVTDIIHLKRAENTAEWIFGEGISVYGFGSELKVSKDKLNAYSKRETEKYKLSRKNFSKNFKKGDDKAILEYDKIYRKAMKEHIKKGGDPKKVLKIPKYY